MSAVVYPMRTPTEVVTGLRHARFAVARGQLVCVPTDTGYALVADAFNPRAVDRLRRARQMPERAPVHNFKMNARSTKALIFFGFMWMAIPPFRRLSLL